eukprot:Skav222737  [mRNA]  locus=scaffold2390:447750:451233:+ [translate_table: standard]
MSLQQSLSDLRWSVQSISGISPARMRLLLSGEVDLSTADAQLDDSSSLRELGFTDGSTLVVEQSTADALRDVDMPVDIPSAGSAAGVYETAATMLGLADSSKLALFAGAELINRNADLSLAPIADGALRLGTCLVHPGRAFVFGGQVAVRSCDTVAEVRQRLLSSVSSELRAETEASLDARPLHRTGELPAE